MEQVISQHSFSFTGDCWPTRSEDSIILVPKSVTFTQLLESQGDNTAESWAYHPSSHRPLRHTTGKQIYVIDMSARNRQEIYMIYM